MEEIDMVRLEAALAALVNRSYASSYITRPEKHKVRAGSVELTVQISVLLLKSQKCERLDGEPVV